MVQFKYIHDGVGALGEVKIAASVHMTEEVTVDGSSFEEEGFREAILRAMEGRLLAKLMKEMECSKQRVT